MKQFKIYRFKSIHFHLCTIMNIVLNQNFNSAIHVNFHQSKKLCFFQKSFSFVKILELSQITLFCQ